MHASNEFQSAEDLRSVVTFLRTNVMERYKKGTKKMFEEAPAGSIHKVYVRDAKGMISLYAETEDGEEGVGKLAISAMTIGFQVDKVVELEKALSWDTELVDQSELRIDRIGKVWNERPSKVTPSMVVKLITSYANIALRALDRPIRVRIKNNQSADGEVLEGLRDSLLSPTPR